MFFFVIPPFPFLLLVLYQAQITIVCDHLKVVCKGEVVIDKRLYAEVNVEKSTFDVRKTKIEIILWKEDKGVWPTIEGAATRPKTAKSESGKYHHQFNMTPLVHILRNICIPLCVYLCTCIPLCLSLCLHLCLCLCFCLLSCPALRSAAMLT